MGDACSKSDVKKRQGEGGGGRAGLCSLPVFENCSFPERKHDISSLKDVAYSRRQSVCLVFVLLFFVVFLWLLVVDVAFAPNMYASYLLLMEGTEEAYV